MKKYKHIYILILLIFVTIGVSFYPNFYYAQKEKKLLKDKETWNFSINTEASITASQVADMYSNNLFSGSIVKEYEGTPNLESIQMNTCKFIWNTFSKIDTQLNEYLYNIIQGELLFYEKTSILTIINYQPVTLSFANVVFTKGDETIELIYEEKTGLLFQFSYSYISDKEGMVVFDSLTKDLFQATQIYYLNNLKLTEDQYYYQCEYFEASMVINFGVNELIYNDDEILIYN